MLIFFKYQSGLGGQSDLTEALQGQLLRRGLFLPPFPGQEVFNFQFHADPDVCLALLSRQNNCQ